MGFAAAENVPIPFEVSVPPPSWRLITNDLSSFASALRPRAIEKSPLALFCLPPGITDRFPLAIFCCPLPTTLFLIEFLFPPTMVAEGEFLIVFRLPAPIVHSVLPLPSIVLFWPPTIVPEVQSWQMEFPKPPVMVLCSASLLSPPLTIQKPPNAELFTPPATALNFPVISTRGSSSRRCSACTCRWRRTWTCRRCSAWTGGRC